MFIKGTKAFINKHHIQIHRCRRSLDLIRHSKGQGQSCHKGFSSGKGTHFPYLPGNCRIHHQVQPSVFPLTCTFQFAQTQLKLSGRHFFKSLIGSIQDLLQIISLYVGFNIHSGSRYFPCQHIVQLFQPSVLLHDPCPLLHLWR